MSYREARQMLSAIVSSLSKRVEESEKLTRELSEHLQVLSVNEIRLGVDAQTAEKERLLSFMQDWMGNVKRVVERVNELQKNIRSVEQEVREMHANIERLSVPVQRVAATGAPVGVVTEDTLGRLSPTEKGVLQILAGGPKAAPEIGRLVSKSREHTARLMKTLFEQGFVEREANRQPYEYRLNDKVREALGHPSPQETTQHAR